MKNPDGIKITCPNPACKYTWVYRGHKKVTCQCPDCKALVKLADFQK